MVWQAWPCHLPCQCKLLRSQLRPWRWPSATLSFLLCEIWGLLLCIKQTGLAAGLLRLDSWWGTPTEVRNPSALHEPEFHAVTGPSAAADGRRPCLHIVAALLQCPEQPAPCWIFPPCGGKLNSLSGLGNPQNGLKLCSPEGRWHFAARSVHARACTRTEHFAAQGGAVRVCFTVTLILVVKIWLLQTLSGFRSSFWAKANTLQKQQEIPISLVKTLPSVSSSTQFTLCSSQLDIPSQLGGPVT